ncbi:MAG TPA: type II toxin-antitoxin system VapC family toxin [Meiothermus sp.]|jgi:predicted nucleic acid-binding protein|nr:type II toxin-antitoxin system VapC family toxin [Meiothermus sp.]
MLVLDTSALVFLYINSREIGQANESEQVQDAVEAAPGVVLSVLCLPEVASAFSRLRLKGKITASESQEAFSLFLEDWPRAERVELTERLALEASALARNRNLHGTDAVHLASAARLSRENKGGCFLSFDERLNVAARGLVKLWGE